MLTAAPIRCHVRRAQRYRPHHRFGRGAPHPFRDAALRASVRRDVRYGDFAGPTSAAKRAAARWLGPAIGITIAMFFYAARNTGSSG